MIRKPPDAPHRLKEADEVEVRNPGVHHAEVKLRGSAELRPCDAVIEELVAKAIARSPDHSIKGIARVVAEMDDLAIESGDCRTRQYGAVAQRSEDRGIERRMHSGHAAFRPSEPVFLPWSDLEAHGRFRHRILNEARRVTQIVPHPGIELVDRPAK